MSAKVTTGLAALVLAVLAAYLLVSVYTDVRRETIRQWQTQQVTR